MSLDLVLLGENGQPEKAVPINVDTHNELIFTATEHKLTKLSRLVDYYGDVKYAFEELDDVLMQIQTLLQQSTTDELRRFLQNFEGLVLYAIKIHKPIEALAD